jgi:acyl-CoA thioester hydrolase
MAPLVETYRGAVYPWHCDHMGHMNVMWYVGKFDQATWSLFSRIGLGAAYLREQGRTMAAVDQHLQYKKELFAGDVVEVGSGVLEMRDKSIRFFHEMKNAETGEICATSRLVGVHIDSQLRKSCPFPDDVVQRGRELVREYHFEVR